MTAAVDSSARWNGPRDVRFVYIQTDRQPSWWVSGVVCVACRIQSVVGGFCEGMTWFISPVWRLFDHVEI